MATKVAERKRTKEELIAAQRFANEAQADGTEVYDMATAPAMRGDVEGALKALARQAARLWEMGALGRFDLRRVDEQGVLLVDGEVEWRGHGAFGIPGREAIAWKAGEHLDEVLALGAERVEARAREALEKPVALPENIAIAASTLKPGELLVLEMPSREEARGHDRLLRALDAVLPAMNAKAIVLEGPVRRENVERLREVLGKVGYDVVPTDRKVPQTDEEFWTAIGMEQGVPYPGLRERIAEWMHLPLTEEQSRAEAERALTINTGLCRACRDRQETCARCGGRTEKTEIGPTMFVAPGEDGRTYSVPICRACLHRWDLAGSTIRDGRIVPKSIELNPLPIPGTSDTYGNFCRRIEREAAEQFRLPAEASTSSSPDTEGRFCRKLVLETPSGGTSKLTPAHTTFADLLAMKKPAVVAVMEPDHDRCARLLEYLFALGGAKVKGLEGGGDRFAFGPVTVWVAHTAAQMKGWPRGFDVAVGFNHATAVQLTDGSPLPLAVHAEEAPRFWGMASAPKRTAPARDAATSEHDRALIDAGYDPRAMTAAQIVEAHGRGLLPGLMPGASLQLVDGKVTVVEP